MNIMPLKLACLDIDDTLLNGHLFNSLMWEGAEPGDVTTNTFIRHIETVGGIKNAKALKATIHDMLEANVQVVLTSFTSYAESIPVILDMIGLSDEDKAKIRHVCFTPPRDVQEALGKNEHIKQAITLCGLEGIAPNEVLLLDDYHHNIELAQAAGYQGIEASEAEGSIGYLNQLRAAVGLNGLPPAEHLRAPRVQPLTRW